MARVERFLKAFSRGWRFHAKAIFFCNVIVLTSCMSDSCKKYTLKCLCWCVERMLGEPVQPGGARVDSLGLEVCFVGLVVGGNCVWYLVIVTLMGFGGGKRGKR